MATIALTINGQTITKTFTDAKVIGVLSVLGVASGVPESATTAIKVAAGWNSVLADAVTTARAIRRAERIAPIAGEVDAEIGLE